MPPSPVKKDFVASLPLDMPAEEVIRLAKEQGIEIGSKQSVHQIRHAIRHPEQSPGKGPNGRRSEHLWRKMAFLENCLEMDGPSAVRAAKKAGLKVAYGDLYVARKLAKEGKLDELAAKGRALPPLEPKAGKRTSSGTQPAAIVRTAASKPAPKPVPLASVGQLSEDERMLMRLATSVGMPRAAQLLQYLQNKIVTALNEAIGG